MSKKGDETKKMITQAATELFALKGFKDVSMSDICEKTGLSRGGLYRHYSSTSEIFSQIISNETSFDERIKNKESALLILNENLNILEGEIQNSAGSLSLAIYEYANMDENSKEFAKLLSGAKKRWADLIEYGIKTKEFNRVDPDATAEMLLYYYQGIRMWSRVMDIGKRPAQNYRKIIVDYLTKGK